MKTQENNDRPLIRTSMNREKHVYQVRVLDKKSQTVPDQTLSLRTILDRYSRGLPIEGTKGQPIYLEPEDDLMDGVNIQTLDLVDIKNRAEAYSEEISRIQMALEEETSSRKKEALKKALKAEIQKELENPSPLSPQN